MSTRPAEGRFEAVNFEFENLPPRCATTRGAGFDEGDVIRRIKEGIPGMALKFSAYYPTTAGDAESGHVLMLGWDHAMLAERREDGYYLDSIYAHGTSTSEDAQIYHLTGADYKTRTARPTVEVELDGDSQCNTHRDSRCLWRKLDLREENVRISKLVTFSLTSCSFGVLWPDPQGEETAPEYYVASHMAFSPPIPLFWIAENRTGGIGGRRRGSAPRRSESLVSTRVQLNLLASVNSARSELDKFTAERIPHTDGCDVTARLMLRGPERLADLMDSGRESAPFKTHPYVVLEFAGDQVRFRCTLGYNNDPTLRRPEKPPFHSLGPAFQVFNSLSGPNDFVLPQINQALGQRIIDEMDKLIRDDYAFMTLHLSSLIRVGKLNETRAYRTPKYDKLMSFQKRYTIPPSLGQNLPAVFRFVEAAASDPESDPQIARSYEEIFKIWQEQQIGCRFPVDTLHQLAARVADTSPRLRTGAYAAPTPTERLPAEQIVGIGPRKEDEDRSEEQ